MIDASSRRTAWLGAILFVSVAVNLLLAGVLLGREVPLFSKAPRPAAAAAAAGPAIPGMAGRLAALPEEERRRFLRAMLPYRPEIKAARLELAEARRRLEDTVIAEPYSPEATVAAMAEVRGKTAQLQQRLQDAAAQALTVLSADSRSRLAKPAEPGQPAN